MPADLDTPEFAIYTEYVRWNMIGMKIFETCAVVTSPRMFPGNVTNKVVVGDKPVEFMTADVALVLGILEVLDVEGGVVAVVVVVSELEILEVLDVIVDVSVVVLRLKKDPLYCRATIRNVYKIDKTAHHMFDGR